MNTTMIFANLNSEYLEKALDLKQGFLSVYTFKEKRNHIIPNRNRNESKFV